MLTKEEFEEKYWNGKRVYNVLEDCEICGCTDIVQAYKYTRGQLVKRSEGTELEGLDLEELENSRIDPYLINCYGDECGECWVNSLCELEDFEPIRRPDKCDSQNLSAINFQ